MPKKEEPEEKIVRKPKAKKAGAKKPAAKPSAGKPKLLPPSKDGGKRSLVPQLPRKG